MVGTPLDRSRVERHVPRAAPVSVVDSNAQTDAAGFVERHLDGSQGHVGTALDPDPVAWVAVDGNVRNLDRLDAPSADRDDEFVTRVLDGDRAANVHRRVTGEIDRVDLARRPDRPAVPNDDRLFTRSTRREPVDGGLNRVEHVAAGVDTRAAGVGVPRSARRPDLALVAAGTYRCAEPGRCDRAGSQRRQRGSSSTVGRTRFISFRPFSRRVLR